MDPKNRPHLQLYNVLKEINARPEPFEFYTAEELWGDSHTSMKMLEYHLNESVDLSSRNKDFIARSVEWILSHLGINKGMSIIDFGCGPGLYTTLFAEYGADVTGIDFSQRSIQHARLVADQKRLDINYIQQNYLEFETEKRFDLITMIYCDYCTLSPAQRTTLLTKFHKLLNPGGTVLLDVYSLNEFENRDEVVTYEANQLNHFWSSDDYYGFVNTFKYDKEKVVLDKYTIIEETRTRVIYNWFQYFSQELLQKEFIQNGFTIDELYSDVAGSTFCNESPELALIARKTGVVTPVVIP